MRESSGMTIWNCNNFSSQTWYVLLFTDEKQRQQNESWTFDHC